MDIISRRRSFDEYGGRLHSPGGEPFSGWDVTTLSGTVLYGNRVSARSLWMFHVNYSNNRPILNNIRLPGVAYVYTPGPDFQGTFGLPFAQLRWKSWSPITLTSFVVIPWIYQAQASYQMSEDSKLLLGMNFAQRVYLRPDRHTAADRIFYDDKRVYLGVEHAVGSDVTITLHGGYGFDRSYFEAESYLDRSNAPQARIDAGYFANVDLVMRP